MMRANPNAVRPAAAAILAGMLALGVGTPARADDSDITAPAVDQVLTPFDVADPAVGRLEPRLLAAIQAAADAASADGIAMTVTSGWRSPEFQQYLLDQAVQTYGSFAAAREYVQTPGSSKHVTGAAVDIGGSGADQWLLTHGQRFGLCQIYANELWHFELAVGPDGSCPPLLPNAASR
jgi:D-alanyl-D-alanine dipeptidase